MTRLVDCAGTPTIGIDFKLRTIEVGQKRIKLQVRRAVASHFVVWRQCATVVVDKNV